MRLAALLTSSSERVQLSVCRALNNLLTMPEVRSRVAEKAQVCTPASVQVRLRAIPNLFEFQLSFIVSCRLCWA
jgi:hypothetical protein